MLAFGILAASVSLNDRPCGDALNAAVPLSSVYFHYKIIKPCLTPFFKSFIFLRLYISLLMVCRWGPLYNNVSDGLPGVYCLISGK